ncbi:MAG TPA: cytochrome c oxidase assembly protein [Rhodocyclaceae bacterium]|nr:cytochrome c oxidase assembly protein [Rhodocyclaceae bacterium]HMV54808.1 cytochrome c oxidase assembly protein [Rhodocyclaceae bacterium]HNB78239.1 cytochrome c oxidase assembly protein [Rhodocyclaceae bacterium]HNC60334.1 cytochrome c oxidase assembly protein [Rhodocyclaceae bacterium]HNH12034.1 cytochrome c oxidase assembly protein [Rhodocyclaceae bacterium]
MRDQADSARSNRRTARRLAAIAVVAFGFGFALVPLYDVICRVAGVGGRPAPTQADAASVPKSVDRSRRVKVELMATAMPGASWDFRPERHQVEVYPGEVVTMNYIVKNPTNVSIIGQAVPSVSPPSAAEHLKKLDCFCFRKQEIGAGETRRMPVTFFVSPEISDRDNSITLSYSFFPLNKALQAN